MARFDPLRRYLERKLNRPLVLRNATDYAGVIEALKSGHVDFAYLGPASYSRLWLISKGGVRPLATHSNKDGTWGSNSVIVVRSDRPYRTLADLRGKALAFADPNSTTGYVAPNYFLRRQGVEPESYFEKVIFSGSHENGIMAVVNGTVDAACTAWQSSNWSHIVRMEEKGMIPKGRVRIVWKSPRMPSSLWLTMQQTPDPLEKPFLRALLDVQREDEAAWEPVSNGYDGGFQTVEHRPYQMIVDMIQENDRRRRTGAGAP